MSNAKDRSKLFRPADPGQLNCVLDYGRPSWHLYCDGYKEAADILAREMLNREATLDTVIYPLAFLYRQYLELRLKQLGRDCSDLTNADYALKGSHKLDVLWNETKDLLGAAQERWSDRSIVVDFGAIDRGINDFAAIDPTSMAFRYPEDLKKQRHNEELTHVNVWNLSQEMNGLQDALENAATAVSLWGDCQQESFGDI